jgi:glycosyltransferase involved in cell wall biosynthesis
MQVLFISQSAPPTLGGVQKHIAGVVAELAKKNVSVDIIAIDQWHIPQTKFLGLLLIWWRLLLSWRQITRAEVIFIHDVFIYFLPWRILLPRKKVVTIFHGFEKEFPIPYKNILYKRLAARLSQRTISIGAYVNKYYGISSKNNVISYGAVNPPSSSALNNRSKAKDSKQFTYLGRLEEDTGLSIFLGFLNILKEKEINFKVDFLGDGPLRSQCQKYGQVRGFVEPTEIEKYLSKSKVCFASGYMSILEALSFKNLCLTAYNSPLKKDYLSDSPFSSAIIIAQNAQDLFDQYQIKSIQNKLTENIVTAHSFQNLAQLYLDCIYE